MSVSFTRDIKAARSLEVVPYHPSLDPTSFISHEKKRVERIALEHLMELEFSRTQLLRLRSSDQALTDLAIDEELRPRPSKRQRFESAARLLFGLPIAEAAFLVKRFDLGSKQERLIKDLCPFVFDYSSVLQIVGSKTKQVMVYGFSHANYEIISDILEGKKSPFQKVFHYDFGSTIDPRARRTADGRTVDAFPMDLVVSFEDEEELSDESGRANGPFKGKGKGKTFEEMDKQEMARECKAAVTALILENFKRKILDLPFIPLIFCVESPHTEKSCRLTVHSLTSKRKGLNDIVSHKELRRIYKLCIELGHDSDPFAQDLAKVAAQTVKMVRIERCGEGHIMTEVRPVWEQSSWSGAWQYRLQKKSPEQRQEDRLDKPHYWQKELMRRSRLAVQNSSSCSEADLQSS